MPVCVLGMHRSGTSAITRLLHVCGLYLGPEDQIMHPSSEDNPEGYWENQRITDFNDELLAALGGSWDSPPAVEPGWSARPCFDSYRSRARALLAPLENQSLWGWKDPRNCLTLEFWISMIPDLKLVVCVRNPVEVARSLSSSKHHLRTLTFEAALSLWGDYSGRAGALVDAQHTIVTHYDAYFYDARAELQRLTAFLGVDVGNEIIDTAVSTLRSGARSHYAPVHAVDDVQVPERVRQLYRVLCDRAGPVYAHRMSDTAYQLAAAETALCLAADRARETGNELASARKSISALQARVQCQEAELDSQAAEFERAVRQLDRMQAERARLADEEHRLRERLRTVEEENESLAGELERNMAFTRWVQAESAQSLRDAESYRSELHAMANSRAMRLIVRPIWRLRTLFGGSGNAR